MRRAIFLVATVLLAALFAWPAAPALAEEAKPQVTEAKSYEIIDQDGNVLASHDATEHMAPASITKIMTAMVALDSGVDLDKTCTIQDMTYQDGAQLAGYKAGDSPTLRELMMAMLVYSANDAAANIAVAVSGSVDKFAELMNKKAQEIGMTNTQFKNPHGLEEDGHYSCAHDLALMGRYALQNYPLIAAAVTTRSVTVTAGGQQKTLTSTDDLMGSYAGLCGIKTGAVESGTTFLGSSRRWGVQLFSAVLGCSTHEGRFTDTAILMDWAYDTYLGRISLARKAWPVRVVSDADCFWAKRVVTAQWDAAGRVYRGQDVTWHTTMLPSDTMLGAQQPFGRSSWTQQGRPVAREVYSASRWLHRVSSYNVFALPLFYDVAGLVS